MVRESQRHGSANFVGQCNNAATDLVELAQVDRNPPYEALRAKHPKAGPAVRDPLPSRKWSFDHGSSTPYPTLAARIWHDLSSTAVCKKATLLRIEQVIELQRLFAIRRQMPPISVRALPPVGFHYFADEVDISCCRQFINRATHSL